MSSYINDSDLPYEEDLLRNTYSVKSWLRYIDFKNHTKSKSKAIYNVYERALKQLPNSYKLWYNFLKLVRTNAKKYRPNHPIYEEANVIHERALTPMHKMPRIWIDFLSFLKYQGFIHRFRRTFNLCLKSLPSTQHKRVWAIALEFIELHCEKAPETALRMYRRYIELAPEETEDFVEFLIKHKRLDEAAQKLVDILNDKHFSSKYGKTKFDLWESLGDLITKNPFDIKSQNVEAIMRQGISKYKDRVGLLWNSLADYYIRSNNIENAIVIYEEAMSSVETVADFKLIFDAYNDFYNSLIKRYIELFKKDFSEQTELLLDITTDKCEYLLSRRALLINSVHLKQNPHNVSYWLERVKLHEETGPKAQFETFQEAIDKIEMDKVTGGRLSQIWKEMARLYLKFEKVDDARQVFDRAVQQKFDKVEDLVDIYCARAEMELKLNNFSKTIEILKEATRLPYKRINYQDKSLPAKDRLHKSLKIWSFYVDLMASKPTFDKVRNEYIKETINDTKNVYETIIDLNICTPAVILNYASYLESNERYEESLTVYQRGVSIFKWPMVYDIWLKYIRKFIEFYKKRHFERGNELFTSCLEHCPAEYATEFYLMYAAYVEELSSSKKAMEVYEKAALTAKPEKKYELFVLYIEKVKIYSGIAKTRPIYDLAIENLDDNDTKKMCIRYAEMETQLGEIDRARTIYSHCSQFCDPRITEQEFWMKWLDFESKFGNSENLSNMNLVKRSVEAKYNTHQNLINVHLNKSKGLTEDSMQNLEANLQKVPNPIAFVSGGFKNNENENPEAIDVDMEDDEENEEKDNDFPESLPIPEEIYGSLMDHS